MSLGPLRPLLMELISALYTEVRALVWPEAAEDAEAAWYDE